MAAAKNNCKWKQLNEIDYGNEIAVSAAQMEITEKKNYQKFAHEFEIEFEMELFK